MISINDMPADKEAMFVCSFICAGLESLLKKEPAPHTKRARKAVELIEKTKALMDLYPGQVTADMLDLASALFDTMEAAAREGLASQTSKGL
jgi:hypothetical protein